jgi:hypothetical protein
MGAPMGTKVVPLALAFALATGCGTRAATGASDAGEPQRTFDLDGGRPADPLAFDSDASLGARADQVFAGCQGGPESACHALGEAETHLRLGPNGDLVNVRSFERPELLRIRPFDPAGSYLYVKVLGDGGFDGGRMPLDGPYDPRLAPFIASWIEAGAPSP